MEPETERNRQKSQDEQKYKVTVAKRESLGKKTPKYEK